MRHITNYIAGLVSLVAPMFCACSDDEVLTPDPAYPNFFEVDASDNSPEAKLRRDFKERTGIYLLFNDHLATYVDADGVEKVEMVDFDWDLTSHFEQYYRFSYLEDQSEKEAATAMIEKYFLPYIDVPGSRFRPYSILIPATIEVDRYNDDDWRSKDYLSCWRCFAVNASRWNGISDDDAKTLGFSLVRSLVDDNLSSSSSDLDDFYAVSYEYYDSYPAEAFPGWMDYQDVTLVYEAGFLTYYPDFDGDPDYDSFPFESTDYRLFKDAIFNEDEAEFREKWSDYPKIIEKYEILKRIIENLGLNLNAVK